MSATRITFTMMVLTLLAVVSACAAPTPISTSTVTATPYQPGVLKVQQWDPFVVKVDSAQSLYVVPFAKSKTVIPFAQDLVFNTGQETTSLPIDCRGFKEMRILLAFTVPAPGASQDNIIIDILALHPSGQRVFVQSTTMLNPPPTEFLIKGAPGSKNAFTLAATFPVMSDTMFLRVTYVINTTPITLRADSSMVYLVN